MEVVKKETPEGTYVYLSGVVDENSAFDQKIGQTKSLLEVNCKGITRINSVGVKSWVRFFTAARKAGVKLTFVECSLAFMQQLSFFQNFVLPEEVSSLYVPLFCEKCRKNEERCFTAEDLRKAQFQVPQVTCSCGGVLAFDDTDDYFQALAG